MRLVTEDSEFVVLAHLRGLTDLGAALEIAAMQFRMGGKFSSSQGSLASIVAVHVKELSEFSISHERDSHNVDTK